MRRGREKRRPRLPLSFVVGRYFVYVLLGAILTVGVPLLVFEALLDQGSVLPANYGERHLQQTIETLSTPGSFDVTGLSSAYLYAHLTASGDVLGTDMGEEDLAQARALVASLEARGTTGHSAESEERSARAAFSRGDGTWCVLSYDILPQWSDRSLRDSWPNPQDIMMGAIVVPTIALVVLVALRASRVLTRKMSPLVDAAEAVGAGEIDFAVQTSTVAQIDDVLAAMERMRRSLRDSLEEQWSAEERQRVEVAALAHDLKSPLTVIRGNAELLGEDAQAGGLSQEQAACAEAIRTASAEIDAFVAQIITTSQGREASSREAVDMEELAGRLASRARELVCARGLALDVETSALPDIRPSWDAHAVGRAVMNLVSNACDYARTRVSLGLAAANGELVITVADDGPGFSPAALAHGRERFFRDDAARGGGEGHFGLGLSIALEVAHSHGGTLELSNRVSPDGSETGAVARLTLPLKGI
ncbi:sensor histidine kinase [Thermophilibacter immobilis]|uniref:histidine kinase n=1 Tax=Thermophilibacter immobilis TaxID=2779519 RepID=A0A7S7RVD1_9ACTN|nr:sensor histidine kinase [Thermophilibacter immobilis]